ncbi:hypothetical protein CJ469_06059 [Nocardia farcinica]|uniref:hypothetical protein n=1 Tax=Nocardia farcinica TaxID=37329 RepID=UPI000C009F2F|nr:hypothetical protein [Nocardia farcinica]PFW98600.1 hypothetical protein CJ469_06059 [Nocardia farcinica]PFX03216.1 hypothetical protein CJ468_05675 [Nocardia farcinica]
MIRPLAPASTDVPGPVEAGAQSASTCLRVAVLGSDHALHARVRAAVLDLGDGPSTATTYSAEAAYAPRLLRSAVQALGGSAASIAEDPALRGALCEWAGIAAPHLLPVLTGHFDLAIGAIRTLGNNSPYQQQLLAELDTADAVGELLLTELGGTNGADQHTTATWDSGRDGYWIDSPSVASWKFMPNIADPHTRKTGVVTARLIVDGRDEGVLPFLLRFRGENGLVAGLHLQALPDKNWAPMDHALIRFSGTFAPRDALLGGDWALMRRDGVLDCALAPRERFHRAISVLGDGRLDLANAAAAMARAGIALTHNYFIQRRPGGRAAFVHRGTVRRDLLAAVTTTYATSILGRHIHRLRTETTTPGAEPIQGIWSMLAKPLLAYSAHQVLHTCRQRAAAQGSLRINRLGEWLGLVDGIITAEGESQLLWRQAGLAHRNGLDLTALTLPDTPGQLPWYLNMMIDREHVLAEALTRDDHRVTGTAIDRDTAAIDLAQAVSERLAATATDIAATQCTDPTAADLLDHLGAVYALERIHTHAGWYTAHQQMTPDRAHAVLAELQRRRRALSIHLHTLIDAFDIPLDGLDAPMAADNYLTWWKDWAGWYSPPLQTPKRRLATT